MKPVLFHPRFQTDLAEALQYYESEAGPETANRFFHSIEIAITEISKNPRLHHFDASGFRGYNFAPFPYHILYFETPRQIAIQVLKHNQRHPTFGLRRQF
ncbi:type II toxin-antitoxin system RelE/ParE family toxin [Roseibacillus persicicus]|uniref:Type II toxin-antitoxin system RelE/ParE family toxin n=1 Tax=Roseibacillus persicicus TaxID=454148 RepID=A0A918TTL6_9BACT|nr:type II toxin-antitoxin system RelE/ParE family toxin [Roseibacillus persicicus]GHC60633.1 hypothetical protein GCM10007100_30030 [Roseibacillus persicicus]